MHLLTSLYGTVVNYTGKPDIRNLTNALREVSEWYQLGIILGILPVKLKKIEEDCQGSDRRKIETLDTWLQQTPSASWSDVVSALQQLGKNAVAQSVHQQYIGGVASKLRFSVLNSHNFNLTKKVNCLVFEDEE